MFTVKSKKILKKLLLLMIVASFVLGQHAPVQAAAKKATYSVSLNKSSYTLRKGKTVKLKATLNRAAKKKGVEWSSSNKKIASVSGNGKVTAKKNGKTTITAKVKGTKIKASCKIIVGTPVSRIKLNKTTVSMKTGEKFTLKANISPAKATTKTVAYTSSNKRVASVSKTGVIRALAAGKAKINVAATDGSGKKASCTVRVTKTDSGTTPGKPEIPENPENPNKPENPNQPENPEDPEKPENPGDPSKPENPENPEDPSNPENPENPEDPSEPDNPEQPGKGKVLVAYFSWSGTSERIAKNIITQTGADSFRIERETPYSDDYTTVAYGEAKDEADANARPPIKDPLTSVAQYEKIIVCYPIWWHTAPMTVGTFLERYDLSGKYIYPVSQSASMDRGQFAQSVEFIKDCAKGAIVDDGLFSKDNTQIENYIKEKIGR